MTLLKNKQARSTTIYALLDPSNGQMKYVGATRLPLMKRLYFHILESRKENTPCAKWIHNQVDQGLSPQIISLEELKNREWQEAETFWQEYFKSLGTPAIFEHGFETIHHMDIPPLNFKKAA